MTGWQQKFETQLRQALACAPMPPATSEKIKCRSVFMSDIHLGTPFCQAESLLEFLSHLRTDNLYLVGDVYDGWALAREWYWPESHQRVIEAFLQLKRAGVNVVYVTGNHDEASRAYTGKNFGDVPVVDTVVHITATGQRMLVLHGDQFDDVVTHAKWLAHVGDVAYAISMMINQGFNAVRRVCGLPYWSLSAFMKKMVKRLVKIISGYRARVVAAAAAHNASMVVCGHVHDAMCQRMGSVTYYNDGDWVESCAALVEWENGQFELIDWRKHKSRLLQSV